MPASTACLSILASSSAVNFRLLHGIQAVVELLDRRRADEHRGDSLVAQRPGQGHLGQRLAARLRHPVERPHVLQRGVGEQGWVERLALCRTRTRRDTLEVLVGEHALRERGERDQAEAGLADRVEQVLLDPAVEHRVGGLVDEQRGAQRPRDLDRLAGARAGVRRDARRTAPGPSGRSRRGRPSSPRAVWSRRSGGCRRCRRSPGPGAPGTGRTRRSGTCASRRPGRRGRATCRSRPCSR